MARLEENLLDFPGNASRIPFTYKQTIKELAEGLVNSDLSLIALDHAIHREAFTRALEKNGGCLLLAAESLGLDEAELRYQLNRPCYRKLRRLVRSGAANLTVVPVTDFRYG